MRRDVFTRLGTAASILENLGERSPKRILDAGCGSGVFLEAACSELRRRWPERFNTIASLATAVTGVDIDESRIRQARDRLDQRFGTPSPDWDLRAGDALDIREEQFDLIVGNPPWIRAHDLTGPYKQRLRAEYETAHGAFDLVYPFIEHMTHLLRTGGTLRFIVPRGLGVQPAAKPLREFMDSCGDWSIRPLPREALEQRAGVDPAVLSLQKRRASHLGVVPRPIRRSPSPIAVTTGVVTGADVIFLFRGDERLIEPEHLSPVLRGRDIGVEGGSPTMTNLVWPYSRINDRWELCGLSQMPGVGRYLAPHRKALTIRPRLARKITRSPHSWYRFVDAKRPVDGPRFVLPDIFREPRYAQLDGDKVAVLNTCFQIIPEAHCVGECRRLLGSPHFWQRLTSNARSLSSGYFRSSVTEIRDAIETMILA